MTDTKRVRIIGRTQIEAITTERSALETTSAYVAPSGRVEQRLAKIWRDILNIDRVGAEDDFFELGGDSLNGVEVFSAIERAFECRLPLAILLDSPTIRSLAAVVGEAGPGDAAEIIVSLRAGGGRAPLFCVHEMSGNVIVYRHLAARMHTEQPVYGVQYPDPTAERPRTLGLDAMASRYVEAIRSVQAKGPYQLLGFSLGGLIAYEIAVRLRAAGERVALLALVDTIAPGHSPKGLKRVLRHGAELFHRRPWEWPSYVSDRLHNRRARQMKDAAIYRSDSPDGLGARLEYLATEIMPKVRPGYMPRRYDGRIVLFRCSDDIVLWRGSPDMGWSGLNDGPLEIVDIASTHQHVMYAPAVDQVARHLNASLE